LRFLVVGIASVATDWTVYRLLANMAGLPLDVAKGLSYWAGVVVGFFGNKWWTFRSTRRSWVEPFSYAAIYAATMLVNIGCFRGLLALLGENSTAWAFLVATGATTVLNFLGMRLFTFRKGVADRLQRETKLPSEPFASGISQSVLRRSA
jgi:putative flippase GtrA